MLKEHLDDRCLGDAVKAARKYKGLTQTHTADLLKITPRYLKAIENSGRKPSYDLFIRIMRELEIPADTIIYPECASPSVKIYFIQGGKKLG